MRRSLNLLAVVGVLAACSSQPRGGSASQGSDGRIAAPDGADSEGSGADPEQSGVDPGRPRLDGAANGSLEVQPCRTEVDCTAGLCTRSGGALGFCVTVCADPGHALGNLPILSCGPRDQCVSLSTVALCLRPCVAASDCPGASGVTLVCRPFGGIPGTWCF